MRGHVALLVFLGVCLALLAPVWLSIVAHADPLEQSDWTVDVQCIAPANKKDVVARSCEHGTMPQALRSAVAKFRGAHPECRHAESLSYAKGCPPAKAR